MPANGNKLWSSAGIMFAESRSWESRGDHARAVMFADIGNWLIGERNMPPLDNYSLENLEYAQKVLDGLAEGMTPEGWKLSTLSKKVAKDYATGAFAVSTLVHAHLRRGTRGVRAHVRTTAQAWTAGAVLDRKHRMRGG